jgi:hypothetical protein
MTCPNLTNTVSKCVEDARASSYGHLNHFYPCHPFSPVAVVTPYGFNHLLFSCTRLLTRLYFPHVRALVRLAYVHLCCMAGVYSVVSVDWLDCHALPILFGHACPLPERRAGRRNSERSERRT